LGGEFMLLHSIHTLANFALKEAVPLQPQTSTHVTVKIYIQYSEFRANSVFRASANCSKILNAKGTFNTVKNCRANSIFLGKRKLFKNREQ